MAFILITLLASASAWTWEEGRQHKCPQTQGLKKFDISYRENTFYHIVRSVQPPFFKGDCVRTVDSVFDNYKLHTDVIIKLFGVTMDFKSTVEYETIPGKYGEYRLFNSEISFHGRIIDTDYSSYFVVYICDETADNKSRRDAFGIFALSPNFDPSPLIHLAYELDFTDEDLERVNHDPDYCGYSHPI